MLVILQKMRSSPLEMKNQQSILSISEPSYSGISDNHIIDPVTSQTKWILSSCNKVQISFHVAVAFSAVWSTRARISSFFTKSTAFFYVFYFVCLIIRSFFHFFKAKREDSNISIKTAALIL